MASQRRANGPMRPDLWKSRHKRSLGNHVRTEKKFAGCDEYSADE
jgi:hypothetical protein